MVIIFRILQKTVQIGDNTQSKMSDCVLNQIVTSFLNGSASRVLNRFFDYIASLPHASGVIHLSVRSDNECAKKFFERNEMELVDKTSWDKGKIEGDVYRKIVKGDEDMFFTPP